jgi:hypothetical protein
MRRFVTVLVLAAAGTAGLLGSGLAAWAKGPTEATVSGPGLAEPVRLELGMHGEAAPRYADFIDITAVFYLGTRQFCRLARPPAAPLGPDYRLTWRLPALSVYYGVDRKALRDPIEQEFYPDATGGAVTRLAGSDTWIRGTTGTRFWWRHLVEGMSRGGGSASGRSDRVSIRGPELTGSVAIDHLSADHSAAVRFFNESGMAQSVLYGGMSPCRESAPPAGVLGPRYTVTWSMASEDWGVQDVYPYAVGGPVIHDRQAAFEMDAPGGWFRADRGLLTVWAALGLPTRAQATGAGAPAGLAATAPESAPVAVIRATSGASDEPRAWLLALGVAAALAIGGAVLLATSGRLGIRWRRHGQPVLHRDGPPGDAG